MTARTDLESCDAREKGQAPPAEKPDKVLLDPYAHIPLRGTERPMKKSFRFQIGRRMSPQEAEGQVSPCYTPRIVCGDIEIEPTRDWITEDHWHTSRITEAIDSDRHDVAWKRIHEFQEWCIERANEQRYDRRAAISLLSVPHRFFRRVLKKEGRHNEELVHLIFEAACDHRDLKYYPREIRSCFRRCKFTTTSVEETLQLYEAQNREPDFTRIRGTVASWK